MENVLTMTVSELNFNIKRLFDSRPGLSNICIRGEISNFKINNPSGHMYLTLKDEKSVLRACMFRREASTLTFTPADGMQVTARGRVSVYEPSGSYQLYIEEMLPDGDGLLHKRFEELKKKLDAEGLFDEEHKKPIPRFPKTVGVATSDTGAAVRDICNIISRRYPACDVLLYPVKVQGQGAAEEVAAAIEYFNENTACDVLIVGRGGGSIEDLWAFNEEIVARAIYNSRIPIISAVGHEIDFTISDFVADLRAPTPSAAAELCVPDMRELVTHVSSTKSRLAFALCTKAETARQRLTYLKESQALSRPDKRIQDARMDVDARLERIASRASALVAAHRTALAASAAALDALSPLGVLSRGYAIVTDERGEVIKSARDVSAGAVIRARVDKGEIFAAVTKTEEE